QRSPSVNKPNSASHGATRRHSRAAVSPRAGEGSGTITTPDGAGSPLLSRTLARQLPRRFKITVGVGGGPRRPIIALQKKVKTCEKTRLGANPVHRRTPRDFPPLWGLS